MARPNLIIGLGSLSIALALIAVLTLVIVDRHTLGWLPSWILQAVSMACAGNLLIALFSHRRFWVQPLLLAFHWCLLLVLLGLALQPLFSYQARLEVLQGSGFDQGHLEVIHHGLLADRAPDDFRQGAIAVEYGPGLVRQQTRSKVTQADGSTLVLREDDPLVIDHYRWSVTSNKGIGLILEWRSANDSPALGSLHFPSYPDREWDQHQTWTTPSGEAISLELLLPPVDNKSAWTLSTETLRPQLNVVSGTGHESILDIGQSVAIGSGRLTFVDHGLWMGYGVEGDPLLPWLLGSGLLGVLTLGLHVAFAGSGNNPPVVSS
jgi:hypothetical protein